MNKTEKSSSFSEIPSFAHPSLRPNLRPQGRKRTTRGSRLKIERQRTRNTLFASAQNKKSAFRRD
jgi:hypothetical protein